MKNALGIPKGVDDIRTAIEVKLKRLRESIKEADEEGDDEAHGGKRNGRSAEEADSSIRISLGVRNTYEELDAATEALRGAIKRLARIKR